MRGNAINMVMVLCAVLVFGLAGCGGGGGSGDAVSSVTGTDGTGEYTGSTDFSTSGGAAHYPKAQSFIAPSNSIARASVYMMASCSTPWRIRILSALPEGGGSTGLVSQTDLDAKTVGFAQVDSSTAGWVDFNFTTPVTVLQGTEYFLFVGSSDLNTFSPSAIWAASQPGAEPGPYALGEGWIYVGFWSNNSNNVDTLEKHIDFAFKVYK